MEKITTDTILGYLQEAVENHKPLPPSTWLDAAMKLNVLLADEHDNLYERQQKVAQVKLNILNTQDKRNVSEAKLVTESSDEYRAFKNQEAKVGRIEEFIRIAKVQARVRETEFKGY